MVWGPVLSYATYISNSLQLIVSAFNNIITMVTFIILNYFCNSIDLSYIKPSSRPTGWSFFDPTNDVLIRCLQTCVIGKSWIHWLRLWCRYIVTPEQLALRCRPWIWEQLWYISNLSSLTPYICWNFVVQLVWKLLSLLFGKFALGH